MEKKKLYRTEGADAKLAGVCGGVAEYFGIDPSIVRILWAVVVLFYGFGLLLYIVAALILPTKTEAMKVTTEYKKEEDTEVNTKDGTYVEAEKVEEDDPIKNK